MEARRHVTTPAGLIVSPDAATALSPKPESSAAVVAFDHDGRRRVVLARTDQKRLHQVIGVLRSHGFNLLAGCIERPDQQPACGGFLTDEDVDGPDRGLGCSCSRIHFL